MTNQMEAPAENERVESQLKRKLISPLNYDSGSLKGGQQSELSPNILHKKPSNHSLPINVII